jgi:hypothetical protein
VFAISFARIEQILTEIPGGQRTEAGGAIEDIDVKDGIAFAAVPGPAAEGTAIGAVNKAVEVARGGGVGDGDGSRTGWRGAATDTGGRIHDGRGGRGGYGNGRTGSAGGVGARPVECPRTTADGQRDKGVL